MTAIEIAVPNVETFEYDDETGVAKILWRADQPPQDAHLKALDDHLLGARLLGPLKPWADEPDMNVQQHGSPGSVHAVVIEAAAPWPDVGPTLRSNADISMARPINFPVVKQVCWAGGLPPCPKTIPVFRWEPQHDFRPLRHLLAWRRWGWPSDGFLAQCAIARVIAEPTLYDGSTENQRHYAWDLRLLGEALGTTLVQNDAQAVDAINKIIGLLWGFHGPNFITLLEPEKQKSSNHLAVVSWQHAMLCVAFDVLIRRGWPDPRVGQLYLAGIKGMDAMRQAGTFTWVRDWDPKSGAVLPAESEYGGTSLWNACAYARSLDLLPLGAGWRKQYLQGFVAHSNALKPTDKNYDAAAHALIAARLAATP